MCGIAGFWGRPFSRQELVQRVTEMTTRIAHRGPDGAGAWVCPDSGLALGHRRLAILDLSDAGAQPMMSANGKWILVFNGEIYNHLKIRAELDGPGARISWRGHSDSETLVEAINRWGVQPTLTKLRGMFAFAAWNRESKTLTLARDRVGEKPLYYGWQRGTLFFGSELAALRAHPEFEPVLSVEATSLFLRHLYVPAPYSIFQGLFKLMPGHLITLAGPGQEKDSQPYWDLGDVVEITKQAPIVDEAHAANALRHKLREVVSAEMIADVPVGVLLSGGIDSLTIATFAQEVSSQPIRTFTVGFDDPEFDESSAARDSARMLGCIHTEVRFLPRDVLNTVEKMSGVYSEPFADSSQLPTYLVFGAASDHCKVVLSGDGGDETFGGYLRYNAVPMIWRYLRQVPTQFRHVVGRLLCLCAQAGNERVFKRLGNWVGQPQFRRKLEKLGRRVADSRCIEELYLDFLTEWRPGDYLPSVPLPDMHRLAHSSRWIKTGDPIGDMMAVDTQTYLADDIFVKVDRASMAHSVEARAPFVDHEMIELAWRLPLRMKQRKNAGKYIIKEVLSDYFPRSFLNRPKRGFGLPLDEWLRGPLKSWASDLIGTGEVHELAVLSGKNVRSVWMEHLNDNANHGNKLWSVLMLKSWLADQRL